MKLIWCVIYRASENYTLQLVTLISRDEKIMHGLFGPPEAWGPGPRLAGPLDKTALQPAKLKAYSEFVINGTHLA